MADYKKKDKVVFLGCKHHFHSDCVKPWFEKAHNCPVCRFDINLNLPASEVKEKFGDYAEGDNDYDGEYGEDY